MIAVTFRRGTVLGTGVAAGVGETVTLEDETARWFVACGRAIFADGSPAPVDHGIVTVTGQTMQDGTTTKKLRTR